MIQLTQEHLKTQLHYDPLTGALSWLVAKPGILAGTPINTISGDGLYKVVGLDYKTYKQHRLIWLYMTGVLPVQEVDHRDGDGTNNTWANLRLASSSENSMNQRKRTDNTSGVKGVSWDTQVSKWRVQIHKAGRRYQSLHTTLEAAALAATNLRSKLHGEFVNHGLS